MAHYISKKYVTASYNRKSTRVSSLNFNVVTVSILVTHPTAMVSPPPTPAASSAINRMKLGIAKKPNGTPQKCVNCGGTQPANFTEYLSHHHHRHQQQQQQQLSLLHQRQSRVKNPTTTAFQFKQAHFPALKPLASAPRPLTTWTQTASQPPTAADLQSVSSMLDTVKFCQFLTFKIYVTC